MLGFGTPFPLPDEGTAQNEMRFEGVGMSAERVAGDSFCFRVTLQLAKDTAQIVVNENVAGESFGQVLQALHGPIRLLHTQVLQREVILRFIEERIERQRALKLLNGFRMPPLV
jgi:hypothetical protein